MIFSLFHLIKALGNAECQTFNRPVGRATEPVKQTQGFQTSDREELLMAGSSDSNPSLGCIRANVIIAASKQ